MNRYRFKIFNTEIIINIRSILTVFFLLLIHQYSFSNNTIEYWEFVHKAENEIVQEKYVEAVRFYDSAFAFLDLPFQKDIHNQIQCAKKLKDYDKVKTQAVFLLENCNLNPKYLRRYKKYYNSENFKEYSKLYKNQKLEKFECISDIDSLFAIDQKIRTKQNYTQNPHLIKNVDSLSLVFFKDKWLKDL